MLDKELLWGYLSGVVTGIAAILIILMILSHKGIAYVDVMLNKSSSEMETEKKIRFKTDLIRSYIDEYYLDEIDGDVMADCVYKGIISGLDDKYAEYYTADEYSAIMDKSSGAYYGIGAYVKMDADTGEIVIVQPMEGGPAEEAGIKAGDIIYAVNDENVTGQDLTTVLSKVKGEENTMVKLTIVREGEADYLDINVERRKIEDRTVDFRMLGQGIGYIKVTGFEEVTGRQFSDAVNTLEKKDMKGLIIDLRDNGGGRLDAAVSMLDRLLPKGLLVYTKDKKGVAEEYYAEDDKQVNIPMAVLVNGNSASASEAFSGALQDEGVAKLVGTTTFGKGIVQTIFGLKDGTALKMTTSKYYTPKGRNIHGTGLTPDVEVELDGENASKDATRFVVDNQMQAAIDILR